MTGKAVEIPEVIDNLRRISQAISEYSRNAVKTTELTGPQLWAIKIIANAARIRVSDLARQMYLRPATVVGILDRLETKGLVTRTRSTEDRRVVDIELSDMGKSLVEKSPEIAQTILVKGLEALPEEQFRSVVEGMKQMVRILGAEHITPQPLRS